MKNNKTTKTITPAEARRNEKTAMYASVVAFLLSMIIAVLATHYAAGNIGYEWLGVLLVLAIAYFGTAALVIYFALCTHYGVDSKPIAWDKDTKDDNSNNNNKED